MTITEDLQAFEALVNPEASNAFPDGVRAEAPTFGDSSTTRVIATSVLPRRTERAVALRLRLWPTTGAPGTAGSQIIDLVAHAADGFEVQVPVTGLEVRVDYRFQFERLSDGKISAIGRTNALDRTAPSVTRSPGLERSFAVGR